MGSQKSLPQQTKLDDTENAQRDQSGDHPVSNDEEKHQDGGKQQNSTSSVAETPESVFTIFTRSEKIMLLFFAGLAAFFSPMTGTIYFAATPILAKDLHVSLSLINLTVTSYLIFQGFAPTIVGSLSDSIGRRPLYLGCFVVYVAANIGLALQKNYAALFVLRCVQASGSSGTVALANAVASDIATSAQRGGYMAYMSIGVTLGPAISPVIGGLLSHFINWQSIFWFLSIFSGVTLLLLFLFLPETCRSVVGNGSLPVPKWNMSFWSYYKMRRRQKKEGNNTDNSQSQPTPRKQPPSLLSSMYILLDKESGIILIYSGVFIAGFYMVLTGLPSVLENKYGYNSLQTGLCYIPGGLGTVASALFIGRFLDWNFKRKAKSLGMEISKDKQQDLTNFPIEAARLELVVPTAIIASATVIAYGWMLEYHVHIAGPMVFFFLATACMFSSFSGLNALIVDLNRDRPSSASAANNLTRCWLGAGASAAVVPLYNAVGIGWTSVLAAGIWIAMCPVVLLVIKYGPKWREEKRLKSEAKKEEEDTNAASRV